MPAAPRSSGNSSPRLPGSEAFQRIWECVAAIPAGSVMSYGDVARRAGLPRRARMVGQALGAAPRELKLPWHRVILASGRLAFPAGSRHFKRQAERLQAEGVEVLADGRVVTAQTDITLDEALWGPPA